MRSIGGNFSQVITSPPLKFHILKLPAPQLEVTGCEVDHVIQEKFPSFCKSLTQRLLK